MEKLIELNYNFNEYDSVIDAKTMEIHYSKHLQGYVNNYNNAVEGTEYQDMQLIEALKEVHSIKDENLRNAMINNGGGVMNHNLYFTSFGKDKNLTDGEFLNEINKTFGSIKDLEDEIKDKGLKNFGSGWTWLVLNGDKLEVINYKNQENPYMDNLIPLLGIDVWEHAYYLKYQNLRAEYLNNIMTIINWDIIEERYNNAKN